MLDALAHLLCSKLCWHNWPRPTSPNLTQCKGVNMMKGMRRARTVHYGRGYRKVDKTQSVSSRSRDW